MIEKPLFIIPGFRHNPTSKSYKTIAAIMKKQGYSPIPVTIAWKGRTISENTEYFLKKYQRFQAKKKYILGFSFGAMIGFLAASKVPVTGIILCSLSPYFQEDMPKKLKLSPTTIRKKRFDDFSRLACKTIAAKVKAKRVHFLYGTAEEKTVIRRVNQAYDQIPAEEKSVLPIRKVEHDIADRRYIAAISQAVSYLSS